MDRTVTERIVLIGTGLPGSGLPLRATGSTLLSNIKYLHVFWQQKNGVVTLSKSTYNSPLIQRYWLCWTGNHPNGLLDFLLDVTYRPDKQNVTTECPSRISLPTIENASEGPDMVDILSFSILCMLFTTACEMCPELTQLTLNLLYTLMQEMNLRGCSYFVQVQSGR